MLGSRTQSHENDEDSTSGNIAVSGSNKKGSVLGIRGDGEMNVPGLEGSAGLKAKCEKDQFLERKNVDSVMRARSGGITLEERVNTRVSAPSPESTAASGNRRDFSSLPTQKRLASSAIGQLPLDYILGFDQITEARPAPLLRQQLRTEGRVQGPGQASLADEKRSVRSPSVVEGYQVFENSGGGIRSSIEGGAMPAAGMVPGTVVGGMRGGHEAIRGTQPHPFVAVPLQQSFVGGSVSSETVPWRSSGLPSEARTRGSTVRSEEFGLLRSKGQSPADSYVTSLPSGTASPASSIPSSLTGPTVAGGRFGRSVVHLQPHDEGLQRMLKVALPEFLHPWKQGGLSESGGKGESRQGRADAVSSQTRSAVGGSVPSNATVESLRSALWREEPEDVSVRQNGLGTYVGRPSSLRGSEDGMENRTGSSDTRSVPATESMAHHSSRGFVCQKKGHTGTAAGQEPSYSAQLKQSAVSYMGEPYRLTDTRGGGASSADVGKTSNLAGAGIREDALLWKLFLPQPTMLKPAASVDGSLHTHHRNGGAIGARRNGLSSVLPAMTGSPGKREQVSGEAIAQPVPVPAVVLPDLLASPKSPRASCDVLPKPPLGVEEKPSQTYDEKNLMATEKAASAEGADDEDQPEGSNFMPSRLLIVVRRLPDKVVPLMAPRGGRPSEGWASRGAAEEPSPHIADLLGRNLETPGSSTVTVNNGSEVRNNWRSDEVGSEGQSTTWNLTMKEAECIEWGLEENEFGLDYLQAFPSNFKKVIVADPGIKFADLSADKDAQRCLRRSLRDKLHKRNIIPVFLDEYENSWSERYSEEVLAPLFHYRIPPVSTGFHYLDWSGYKNLNIAFLNTIVENYQSGDWILVFNYQLMLLPKMLRDRPITREANIGFYLATVFPSSEMYRILPQREELLRGVLAATFIGFHGFQYKRHFLTACTRVLGVECSGDRIEPNAAVGSGAGARVVTVSRGINPSPWLEELQKSATQKRIADLRSKLQGRKVLLGIDTLDYTKGIPNKMLAFNKFLTDHPEWASKVVFFQICVPKGQRGHSDASGFEQGDRIARADRREILAHLYQLVGSINANFGSILNQPVHFLLSPLNMENLVCLYAVADIMVITPLRESLSWNAYEFVLCQSYTNKGVLILSEFSGSALSLGAAAICVNPWDPQALAVAIHDALVMRDEEKLERHEYAFDYVLNYNAESWGRNLLMEFQEAVADIETERRTIPPAFPTRRLVPKFYEPGVKRLLILGLRGTLFSATYRGMDPQIVGKVKLPKAVEAALNVLSHDDATHLLIVSSSPCSVLQETLGHLSRATLLAENGHFVRPAIEKGASRNISSSLSAFQSGGSSVTGITTPDNAVDGTNPVGNVVPDVEATAFPMSQTQHPQSGRTGSIAAAAAETVASNQLEFKPTTPDTDLSWMDAVEETCRYFEQRTPGSFLYRTATSVAWNYQGAQREHGTSQARDLLIHLWAGPATVAAKTDIVVGPHSVEVRSAATCKAAAVEQWLHHFFKENGGTENIFQWVVLCMANFLPRDEDVFSAIVRCVGAFSQRGDMAGQDGGESGNASFQDLTPHTVSEAACGAAELPCLAKNGTSPPSQLNEKEFASDPLLEQLSPGETVAISTLSRRQSPQALGSGYLERMWMCTVGLKPSRADFLLSDEKEVEHLLTLLAAFSVLRGSAFRSRQLFVEAASDVPLESQVVVPSLQEGMSGPALTAATLGVQDRRVPSGGGGHLQRAPAVTSHCGSYNNAIYHGRFFTRRKAIPTTIDVLTLLDSPELQRAIVATAQYLLSPTPSTTASHWTAGTTQQHHYHHDYRSGHKNAADWISGITPSELGLRSEIGGSEAFSPRATGRREPAHAFSNRFLPKHGSAAVSGYHRKRRDRSVSQGPSSVLITREPESLAGYASRGAGHVPSDGESLEVFGAGGHHQPGTSANLFYEEDEDDEEDDEEDDDEEREGTSSDNEGDDEEDDEEEDDEDDEEDADDADHSETPFERSEESEQRRCDQQCSSFSFSLVA